eukprot:6385220-Amphidinium_carterae.1
MLASGTLLPEVDDCTTARSRRDSEAIKHCVAHPRTLVLKASRSKNNTEDRNGLSSMPSHPETFLI